MTEGMECPKDKCEKENMAKVDLQKGHEK